MSLPHLGTWHYLWGRDRRVADIVAKRDYDGPPHHLEVHGCKAEGFAVFLADGAGVGVYLHVGSFARRRDAYDEAVSRYGVRPRHTLHYHNNGRGG